LETAQDGFMGKLRKVSVMTLLLLLAAASLIAVNSSSAQSIPKPSVPEFSVKLVAHPYDVPPKTTTTIDQYTGEETTTTQPGYRVENKSIEVTITSPLRPTLQTAMSLICTLMFALKVILERIGENFTQVLQFSQILNIQFYQVPQRIIPKVRRWIFKSKQ
jgi:hypothetical protein